MVSVLLSASVERVGVSRMRDFFKLKTSLNERLSMLFVWHPRLHRVCQTNLLDNNNAWQTFIQERVKQTLSIKTATLFENQINIPARSPKQKQRLAWWILTESEGCVAPFIRWTFGSIFPLQAGKLGNFDKICRGREGALWPPPTGLKNAADVRGRILEEV